MPEKKDKSANERLVLNQQISQKEAQIEELQKVHREVEQMLSDFEMEMGIHFRRLQDSYEAMMAMGSTKAKWQEADRQSKQQYLNRIINDHQDELNCHYVTAIQSMDEEKNQLQKERDELPWD